MNRAIPNDVQVPEAAAPPPRAHRLAALVLVLVSAVNLGAQALNDPDASLTFNGVDGAPPNVVTVTAPAVIAMQIQGDPLLPFLLVRAAVAQVGAVPLAGESVDLQPATAQVIWSGVEPGLPSLFANTGAAGIATFSLPLSVSAPVGSLGAFQVAVLNPALPAGLALGAASTLFHDAPDCDYGSLSFVSRDPLPDVFAAFRASSNPITIAPSAADDLRFEDLQLNRINEFNQFTNAHRGDVDRLRMATPERPLRIESQTGFQCIRTVHGDLYAIRTSGVPERVGYLLAPRGGGMPRIIDGTLLPTFGSLSVSPYSEEVAISADSSMLGVASFNGVRLVRLDGTVFSQTGTPVVDVTPPVGASRPRSLHFAGNRLHFRYSGGGAAPFPLYAAEADPAGFAAPVAAPGALNVDDVMFNHAPSGDLYFRADDGNGVENLYFVSAATGAVTNVTGNTTPSEVREFGDTYRGVSGRIAASPSGGSVAFVVRQGGSDELVMSPQGGPLITVTDAARFAPAIDTIVDLRFRSNTAVTFFAGTATNAVDLYEFDFATGTVTNLSNTSGQSGATLPITTSPAPVMSPRGYFTFASGAVFRYAAGGRFSLARVDDATGAVTNITGSLMSGPPGPSLYTGRGHCLAVNADTLWFSGSTAPLTLESLYVADLSAGTPATIPSGTLAAYSNLVPNHDGTRCLAIRELGTDQEVVLAESGVGTTQVSTGPGANDSVLWGTLGFLDPSAPCDGVYFAQRREVLGQGTALRLFVVDVPTLAFDAVTPESDTDFFYVFSAGL